MAAEKYNIAFLMHGAKNVGGGEYSIYLLIKNLRRDVFDPVVFYSNENEIVKRLREDGIQLVNISLSERITSVYRDRIKWGPLNLIIYLFYLIAAVLEVKRSLRRHQVRILHPHDNLSKVTGGVAASLCVCGVKVVAHCRDDLKNDFLSKVFRFVYQHLVDHIIAVSEKTKMALANGAESILRKTSVIYNGVDLDVFSSERDKVFLKADLGIEEDKVVITCIAVLEKYKGHICLFRAIKQLRQDGLNDFVCLIVGDGREKDDLIKYVMDEGLEKFVSFLGYRKDIPELLGIADILVIPSIGQEAFPRVVIEAMAMKLPVVGTAVGGIPEAIDNGNTGIIAEPGDVDSLSKGIEYLIRNPDARRRMGEAGRKRVEELFDIKGNIRKTEERYLDVLKDL